MIRYDILICGIGGQGVISLGTILKLAAIEAGLMVVGAERRGGAQREGVVTSNVRYFGLEPHELPNERQLPSGTIPTAGAHMLIALEPLEALRHIQFINPDTVVIINDFPLIPVPVRMGSATYPQQSLIKQRLLQASTNLYALDLNTLAKEHFASLLPVNTICLGMAYALGDLPVDKHYLLKTLAAQYADVATNQNAFSLGVQTAKKMRALKGADYE